MLVINDINAQIIREDRGERPLRDDPSGDKVSPIDTIGTDRYTITADRLDCKVDYQADSSRMVPSEKMVYLYGNAIVKYCNYSLTAYHIKYNSDTGLAEAFGEKDSLDNYISRAEFSEGQRSFQSEELAYNFKSKKGRLKQLATQEGEGIIQAEKFKKISDDIGFGKAAFYTTCNLENPHFHFKFDKLKVKNKKLAVGTNMNLYIMDIPTPVYFPFGIFPLQRGRRAGLLRPSPGFENLRGFELQNLGWYQPINDNMDAEIRGDIYTSGSWRFNTALNYRKRYKYSGGLNLSFNKNRNVDISEAVGLDIANSFQINWRYNQDAKVWPYANFNANVQFGKSNFKTLNVYDPRERLNNQYSSSISYNKTFPNSPFNLSSNIRYNQNTSTNRVSISLPTLNISSSTIYPFRSKTGSSSSGLLDNLSLSYSSNFRNEINTIDSVFFSDVFGELADGRYGASHRVPVSASFKLLKYLNFSPSVSYNEVWASQTIRQNWDNTNNRLIRDTVKGFRSVRWYQPSVGFNTTVYGQKDFKKGKIAAIRHVVRPSVSFSYTPDFTDDRGSEGPNFYEVQSNAAGNTTLYSIFDGGLFGGPPRTSGGSVGFNLGNNLELKVKSKKDTTGFQKIKIFENLNFSSSYNLGADSLKWSNITFNGNTRLFEKINMNLSGSFNPYATDPLTARTINKSFASQNKGIIELQNINFRMGGSLRSKESSSNTDPNAGLIPNPFYTGEQIFVDNYNKPYIDFSIPWDLNLNYNFSYRKQHIPGDKRRYTTTQNITGGGNFSITDNWKLNLSSGYDIRNGEINYTNISINRDLHCWQMGFNWSPVGQFKRYLFTIQPKSGLLRGVKLDKRRTYLDNFD